MHELEINEQIIYNPSNHIENVADLTVENLKEQLLREKIYTQNSVQRSELTEIRNELTFCSESAPMATVTKSAEKNNEQTISMQPNIGTNKEYQDLRKPG